LLIALLMLKPGWSSKSIMGWVVVIREIRRLPPDIVQRGIHRVSDQSDRV